MSAVGTSPTEAPAGADQFSRCPRCGASFHCGAHDAAPCPCSTLTLSPTLQADLRNRYTGCLCLRCLTQLAGGAPIT